jgi:hypothetical protein
MKRRDDASSYIVVEGQADAELLDRLFTHAGSSELKVIPAHGWSSALSLARTLLLSKNRPVVIALDADEKNSEQVQELVNAGLAQVASPRRWRVLVFEPDIETELLRPLKGTSELRRAKSRAQRRSLLSDKLKSVEFIADLKRLPKLKATLDFVAATPPLMKAV